MPVLSATVSAPGRRGVFEDVATVEVISPTPGHEFPARTMLIRCQKAANTTVYTLPCAYGRIIIRVIGTGSSRKGKPVRGRPVIAWI